jgi:hypothetical protein
MIKKSIFLQLFLILTIKTFGQNSVYLERKHIDKDSTWIVENTECEFYFLNETGMKANPFGWFQLKELIQKNCDLLYFEANTFGAMRIVLELPKGIKSIKLDTLTKDRFQLINNHYGSLRRNFERKNNTVDILSGTLIFDQISDEELIINGKINVDSKEPTTHQEIVFNKHKTRKLKLSEVIDFEKQQELKRKKQEEKQWAAYELVSRSRASFYDSVFNLVKYPNNKIVANLNRKVNFDFTIDNSYILVDAHLTDSAKHDLMELLGGNILASIEGNKKVFVLHSFYDPEKNSIDDEINYSLNIEFDDLVIGKTYKLDSKNNDFVSKLAFWHYGPHGTVITSKQATGTISITNDDILKTTGTLNLTFKNTDKSTITLAGGFELPKLKVSDISDLETRIRTALLKFQQEK